MTLEEAAFVSQIVSAIAVAASLVFVGVQMRQNTKAVRASTSQAHSANYHEIVAHLIDGAFAEVWRRGAAEPSALTETERVQFLAFASTLYRFYEASRVQWQRGNLDDEHWHTIEQQAVSLAGLPGVKYWWTLRRQWHSAEFREWLESLTPAAPEALYGQSNDAKD
jgi:hypothetical protein